MGVNLEVDHASRIVTLEVTDEIDDAGLLGLVAELEKASGVKPDFALLVDLRHANGKRVTSRGVRALVGQPLLLSPASRRAVVVESDLGFGMARMYEMLREDAGPSMRIFRDVGEARRWLLDAGR